MIPRHRVFLSYDHDADRAYGEQFELLFRDAYSLIVPGSIGMRTIDPTLRTETVWQKIRNEYLRDTSVTVVLVGARTWTCNDVDWEISSSIRDTEFNPRSGLLGILLPTDPSYGAGGHEPRAIPPRLHDNLRRGFAILRSWSNDPALVRDWIHEAYVAGKRLHPDNSRPSVALHFAG